jgi:predicted RNase H-like nuclease
MSAPARTWTIVGVDCAIQEERIGLARATLEPQGKLHLERVTLGTAGESAAASVSQWIAQSSAYVLALDAPLGWPQPLGATLVTHVAGAALPEAEALFRRDTDRLVQKTLGKNPPEVGADRIARTARAALGMLAAVRSLSSRKVPLAWQQAKQSGAIEVYPAATLISRGVAGSGYKAATPAGRRARAKILERLASELEIEPAPDVMIEDANLFDAMLCALAGADYARGLCVEPTNPELARKEGFIWFRGSGQRTLFPRT